MADICLNHFLEAQKLNIKEALAELTAGKKRSHWMWYIFPQIVELGYSERPKRYGIRQGNCRFLSGVNFV